jgi:hypothetical protein
MSDEDRAFIEKIKTISIRSKSREQLPLGNKSRGRYLTHEETGGADVFIPSFGALEKEEIDYIAEAEIEKEKTRVRRTPMKENMEKVVGAMMRAPKGKRGEKFDEIQEGNR